MLHLARPRRLRRRGKERIDDKLYQLCQVPQVTLGNFGMLETPSGQSKRPARRGDKTEVMHLVCPKQLEACQPCGDMRYEDKCCRVYRPALGEPRTESLGEDIPQDEDDRMDVRWNIQFYAPPLKIREAGLTKNETPPLSEQRPLHSYLIRS